MAVTFNHVREIFKELENGDGAAFFELVADDVARTVMGTHLPRSRESSLGWTGRSLRRASTRITSSPGDSTSSEREPWHCQTGRRTGRWRQSMAYHGES